MNQLLVGFLLLGGMLSGVLGMLETGRRIRLRHKERHTEAAGLGAVEGAVFGLMGLLIAFTFSGAGSRFDDRRALIVEEANDIGTAYLRLDLLAPESQPALRQKFRDYTDARLAVYRALPDMEAAKVELERATALQKEIWALAVGAGSRAPTPQATMLLLPALNAMIDITTTRTAAARMHPPVLIFVLLGVLALGCSLLAGYGMAESGTRNWVHVLGFAVIVTVTIYIIIDFEFPRFGLLRVSAFDRVLVDVRASME